MSGATTIAALAARARRQLARHFTEAGATAPERVIAYDLDDASTLMRAQFTRLMKASAIVEAKPGFYWFDEGRYAEHQRGVRKRAMTVLGAVGAIAAVAIALTR